MFLLLTQVILLFSGMARGDWNRLPICKDEVAAKYNSGMTMDAIAIHFGTNKRTIANRLISAGVKSRGYDMRYNTVLMAHIEEYFKNWSRQSAYILGYTMADGSVSRPSDRSPSIQYSCVTRDREILDGIAKELNLPSPSFRKGGETVSLRIHGERAAALYESFGIHPRKTWLDTPFPEMPEHCLPHYIRGVIDGDGCVYHRHDFTSVSVQILGTKSFLEGLRDALVKRLNLRRVGVLPRPGHFCVAWQSPSAMRKIHDFIYPEGEYIYLRRKKQKFEAIFAHEHA